MRSLHVVFGTGTIGRALIDELILRGLQVRSVSRSPSAGLPDGVKQTVGDASDPAFAIGAAKDSAAVYQCMNPPYHKWTELFPPLQRAVLAGAKAAGARYVSFENVYMYGDTKGVPITERLANAAHTRKGKVRAAMAEELALLASKGELEVVTARASDYFGPRATDQSPLGDRVIGNALKGKPAQVIGNPDQPHSYTYAPDAARTLATLGTHDRAVGQVWHVPNAPAKTTREMIAMIGRALGRNIKVQPAPRLILKLMGLFNPTIRELDEMLYEFEQPFIVDGSKFERTFGISATPFEASIPATVAWWRAAAGDQMSSTHLAS
jgi:nucleoside-diphosphate-sugar epimerase